MLAVKFEEDLQHKQLAGVHVIVRGGAPSKPQQCILWRERNGVSETPVENCATQKVC